MQRWSKLTPDNSIWSQIILIEVAARLTHIMNHRHSMSQHHEPSSDSRSDERWEARFRFFLFRRKTFPEKSLRTSATLTIHFFPPSTRLAQTHHPFLPTIRTSATLFSDHLTLSAAVVRSELKPPPASCEGRLPPADVGDIGPIPSMESSDLNGPCPQEARHGRPSLDLVMVSTCFNTTLKTWWLFGGSSEAPIEYEIV